MSYLGLDVGTSGCKALIFNRAGRPLASASREYRIQSDQPGWAELDPSEVGDACLEVIREAASQCPQDPVTALGISTQGEAFTVLDARDRVLHRAMVSSDVRAAEIAESWPTQFGAERLYQKTGHTAHPIFSLFKLLWLRQERPELWRKVKRVLCFEDYLHLRLGVEPAISFSLAARTLMFNVRDETWDAEILAEAGLEAGQLARPLPPGSAAGRVPEPVARNLGISPGALVVAGGHDQVCAALGAGAVQPGMAALGSGTVECLAIAFAHPVLRPEMHQANLCTYSHAAPGLYATLAYHLTGGNLLAWFRNEFAPRETGDGVYDRLLELMPAEPASLLALPYFTASGTPYFDARTPGAIFGLRLGTPRGEILRALLEGLALEMAVNLEILSQAGIEVLSLSATGGGARNDRWLQLKADVLNRPIQVPEVTEAGCLGTALLACAAAEATPIPDLLKAWIVPRKTFEPNPATAGHYQSRLAAYRKLYATLRELAREIF